MSSLDHFQNAVLSLGTACFIEPIRQGLMLRGVTISTQELLDMCKLPCVVSPTVNYGAAVAPRQSVASATSSEHVPGMCVYQITKGTKNKGAFCNKRCDPGNEYCNSCLGKAGVRKTLGIDSGTTVRKTKGTVASGAGQLVDPADTVKAPSRIEPYDPANHYYYMPDFGFIVYWEPDPNNKDNCNMPVVMCRLQKGNPELGTSDATVQLTEEDKMLAANNGLAVYQEPPPTTTE